MPVQMNQPDEILLPKGTVVIGYEPESNIFRTEKHRYAHMKIKPIFDGFKGGVNTKIEQDIPTWKAIQFGIAVALAGTLITLILQLALMLQ